MSNPEVLKPSGERGAEARDAAGEQLQKLQEQREKRVENGESGKETVTGARREAEAAFAQETGRERRSGGEPTATATHATKKQRKDSYSSTMRQIQSEMNVPARTFSKVIHNPVVEKTSNVVGSSIARPNAVLAGSMMATFMTLFVFIVAKQYGYRLSGFETIATFLLGWSLGLIYDYARLMVVGRRS